jgi:dephospho-CoA kinase
MHIALTGGIGSGKSYVCRLLEDLNIKVYDCDAAAKRLILTLPKLQQELSLAVGRDLFEGGKLDKAALSRFIVESEDNNQKINSLVHPAVASDFLSSGYEWLESAILFESGFNKRVKFDFTVCVAAPLETRISRIMQRDNLTRGKALEWIARQMPQEEKAQMADFVIDNDGKKDIKIQVQKLLEIVNKQLKSL